MTSGTARGTTIGGHDPDELLDAVEARLGGRIRGKLDVRWRVGRDPGEQAAARPLWRAQRAQDASDDAGPDEDPQHAQERPDRRPTAFAQSRVARERMDDRHAARLADAQQALQDPADPRGPERPV